MKIKFLFIALILSFSLFISQSIVDAYSCQGQGDPNFCYTGNYSPPHVAVCSYSCGYDGYTCQPSCDEITYFESCTDTETLHCTQVEVGCPRCGNVHSCYTKTVISPTAVPTEIPTPPPPTPPTICQAGTCDVAHSCRVYTAPSGSVCSLNGETIPSGTCVPDASCAPTPPPQGYTPPVVPNTCEPNNGTCMQPGQCSTSPNPNYTCSGAGQVCCPNNNPPPAATSTPAQNTPIPPPNATATPRPPADTCQDGAACTQASCKYPDGSGDVNSCAACGGNWCDGGRCHCPPPAIKPSATPNPPTPTPSYIEVQNVATPTPKPATPGGKPAQSWKCLKSEPYTGPIKADGVNSDHQLALTGFNFPNNKNIYVVGCALLNGNFQCTTGDSSLDSLLHIRKASEHEFAVAGGPIVVTTDNSIAAIVRSSTATSTIHTFFGVYSQGPDGNQNDQSGNTLQLGTFEEQAKNVSYKCTGVRWDPYGRVFDNDSLEPIPGINLELLSETKKLVSLPGLVNPVFTNTGGEFNFLVEPGTYYLNPTQLKNYSVVSANQVNPDAKKAYLNIYSPGEKIVEKAGKPEHRDIALDPGSNVPYQSKPKSLEFTALPVPGTSQTRLVGQVTHPLTIVSFQQNEKEITQTVADNFGYYEVLVENSQIQPGVKIVPAFKKVPLTTIKPPENQSVFQKIALFVQSFFKRTSAAPEPAQGAAIDLIPHYIQGYVYTSLGQKIDKANVEVILKMSNESVYETQTDATGLITIPADYMPIFPFYLRVTPDSSPTSFAVTTTQFMEQNRAYFQEKGINLMINSQ